ncbi:MAG: type II toxin-antitoxin system HicB family antitoxin [Candidatus Melainabacteria bacterium]|nr:type II toxin-antitoxin system HicB family antitoxin [Candidatus Melainabacteria bacterium]
MKAKRTYTVKYERDEAGWWVASVAKIKGCHTQGRTIDQARRRIREAISLFIDDVNEVELEDDIRLPDNAMGLLKQLEVTRKRAEQEKEKLQTTMTKAAQLLTRQLKISVRDAGEVLGLSHQRVHQLLNKTHNRCRKPTDVAF